MADTNEIFGVNTLPIVVPAGATNAVLIQGVPGQRATLLKYFSGGTLMIIGCTVGSTLTAAELAAAGSSLGYVFGSTEAVSIDGPTRFYLMSLGATSIVMQIKGLSAGF